MSKSLITGATGLLVHQQKLDVVASNIANLNTTGFKSQRVLFSDLIYTDRAPAVGASGDVDGGVNPIQVGNGVRVAEVSQNFTQGVLNASSGEFDYALDGDGFFVIKGDQQAYTRDGSFSVDSSGYLVDPATVDTFSVLVLKEKRQGQSLVFKFPETRGFRSRWERAFQGKRRRRQS